MTLRAMPSDPGFASRHAAWVRSGKVGVEPRPRWAASQAIVDAYREPSVGMIRRAAYAALAVKARLGILITD